MKSEDGTGSRHPLLGDAGMSPRLFQFPIPKEPQNGDQIHSAALCFTFNDYVPDSSYKSGSVPEEADHHRG